MRIFNSLIGFSIVNAHIWYDHVNKTKSSHREFTGMLAEALLERGKTAAAAAAPAAHGGDFVHYIMHGHDLPAHLLKSGKGTPKERHCVVCKKKITMYCKCLEAVCSHGPCFVTHLRNNDQN
jgi:hypothetical protein